MRRTAQLSWRTFQDDLTSTGECKEHLIRPRSGRFADVLEEHPIPRFQGWISILGTRRNKTALRWRSAEANTFTTRCPWAVDGRSTSWTQASQSLSFHETFLGTRFRADTCWSKPTPPSLDLLDIMWRCFKGSWRNKEQEDAVSLDLLFTDTQGSWLGRTSDARS